MITAISLGTRYDLLQLCDNLDYRIAVEVGVGRGKFSRWILLLMPGCVLYSIDPWRNADGEFNTEYLIGTVGWLREFGDRSRIVIASSPAVVDMFEDESVDFVYIDGDHRYEAVKADLHAWWPKVRQGGILAGDDYAESLHRKPTLNEKQLGKRPDLWRLHLRNVRDPVHEFVQETGVSLNVTTIEDDKFSPNFWFMKDA